MDGAGVAAALAAGAAGAWMGTAFLATREADTAAWQRRLLLSPPPPGSAGGGGGGGGGGDDTVVTQAFTGRAARGLANRLTRELEGVQAQLPGLFGLVRPLACRRGAAGPSARRSVLGRAASAIRDEPTTHQHTGAHACACTRAATPPDAPHPARPRGPPETPPVQLAGVPGRGQARRPRRRRADAVRPGPRRRARDGRRRARGGDRGRGGRRRGAAGEGVVVCWRPRLAAVLTGRAGGGAHMRGGPWCSSPAQARGAKSRSRRALSIHIVVTRPKSSTRARRVSSPLRHRQARLIDTAL
jgi:hypothetical protein